MITLIDVLLTTDVSTIRTKEEVRLLNLPPQELANAVRKLINSRELVFDFTLATISTKDKTINLSRQQKEGLIIHADLFNEKRAELLKKFYSKHKKFYMEKSDLRYLLPEPLLEEESKELNKVIMKIHFDLSLITLIRYQIALQKAYDELHITN